MQVGIYQIRKKPMAVQKKTVLFNFWRYLIIVTQIFITQTVPNEKPCSHECVCHLV